MELPKLSVETLEQETIKRVNAFWEQHKILLNYKVMQAIVYKCRKYGYNTAEMIDGFVERGVIRRMQSPVTGRMFFVPIHVTEEMLKDLIRQHDTNKEFMKSIKTAKERSRNVTRKS